jgi:threonine dehydrogenase-like Zn-dependent dehydrogenase
VRGFDVLRSHLADHVLIYGPARWELAKRAGAATVEVVDLNPARLETAWLLGCTAIATTADELDRPRGWDVVVDCTGVVAAIEDGLSRVAPGGTFQQFGVSAEKAEARFSPYRVYNKEITMSGRGPCCTASNGPATCSSAARSSPT